MHTHIYNNILHTTISVWTFVRKKQIIIIYNTRPRRKYRCNRKSRVTRDEITAGTRDFCFDCDARVQILVLGHVGILLLLFCSSVLFHPSTRTLFVFYRAPVNTSNKTHTHTHTHDVAAMRKKNNNNTKKPKITHHTRDDGTRLLCI